MYEISVNYTDETSRHTREIVTIDVEYDTNIKYHIEYSNLLNRWFNIICPYVNFESYEENFGLLMIENFQERKKMEYELKNNLIQHTLKAINKINKIIPHPDIPNYKIRACHFKISSDRVYPDDEEKKQRKLNKINEFLLNELEKIN